MSFIFELERDTAVLNFSSQYCQTKVELVDSVGFDRVLCTYIQRLLNRDATLYHYLLEVTGQADIQAMTDQLKQLFKLLLVLSPDEIQGAYAALEQYLRKPALLLEFIEGFYDYWRHLGRYAIVFNTTQQQGIQNSQFIETHARFGALVLSLYRTISERLIGTQNRVYRQLIAGVNAGLIVSHMKTRLPETMKSLVDEVMMIESIVLHPPFITYPKRNTRTGTFEEVWENPLQKLELNPKDYFGYPAKVGDLLMLVYFHKDFMSQGVTLCNLFELATMEEVATQKPDAIYVYGAVDQDPKTVFFHDDEHDLYIGYVSYHEDFDYFGYMKKMMLTLHNVKMLDMSYLPLHGAMASLTMQDSSVKNVVIIGDSGAGKSETLEALRSMNEGAIKDIKIIFDDMGVLGNIQHQVVAHGTEIGAFVRLDDLETGYAYKEIDRSIFMNPNKTNARIVIPVATYAEIVTRYPIDVFLYANNYDAGAALQFFDNTEQALSVFKTGARMAKGTTSETGLVETYFANPFGPVQRQQQTEKLLQQYFNQLFTSDIEVGEIRTKLGLKGQEKLGPMQAAEALLAHLQAQKKL